MGHLKTILLFVFIIGCTLQAYGADKYTDENRPYEFGFTIDGQQHRHEKKDKNGIIMGEFGFITADGVYHVTVYATDEQGRFKILSMKNIRVKPYPTSPSVNVPTTSFTTQDRNPKALEISNTSAKKEQSTAYSNSPQTPLKESINREKEIIQINNAGPAKSCSHCSVPTTTTLAPKLPTSVPTNNNNQYQQNNYGFSQVNKNYNSPSNSQQYPGQNDLPSGTISNQQQEQNNNPNQEIYRDQYSQKTINQQQRKSEDSGIAYNRGQDYQPNSNDANSFTQKSNFEQNYQQNSGLDSSNLQAPAIGGYQQYSRVNPIGPQVPITGGNIQQNSDVTGPQVPFVGRNYEQNSGVNPNAPQVPITGGNVEQNKGENPNTLQVPITGGNVQQNSGVTLGGARIPITGRNYEQNSGVNPNSPQVTVPNYPSNGDINQQSSVSINQENINGPQQNLSEQSALQNNINEHRNPKSFRDILKSAIPDQQYFNSGASSHSQGSSQIGFSQPLEKPVLIAAQMQLVGKDTNIYHKNPGESDGLPKGLSEDDMSHLLYTFNYTVGFHGHHEEGYSNGVKQGYYYVVGRNGVRTRVDYVADEKGFRPRISQETLDISSDDVPKPDTEKDEKYGLKGYEFKWLYYPEDSRKR